MIHDLPNETLAEADDSLEAKDPPVTYHIDPVWYAKVGKSFSLLLRGRMCSSCRQKFGTQHEERVPTHDEKTGKVTFEVKRTTYGEDPVAVIQSCCSKAADFISPGMPIKEIIFRILLSAGNEPLEMEEIKRRLDEHLGSLRATHNTSIEVIKRLLDKDNFYGIRPVEAPEVSSAAS